MLHGCHLASRYASSEADAAPDAVSDQAIGADLEHRPDQHPDAPAADGPRSVCSDPPDGVVFCDGYEDPAFTAWRYVVGGVRRDVTSKAIGGGALHAQTVDPGGRAYLSAPIFGPFTSGELYLRTHIFLPHPPEGGSMLLFFLGEDDKPYHHLGLGMTAGGATEVWLEEPFTDVPATPLPQQRWVCVELQVRISNTDGEVRLLYDGQQVGQLAGIDTLPGEGITTLEIGLPWTDPATVAAEVWIDETVLSTKPIPCD